MKRFRELLADERGTATGETGMLLAIVILTALAVVPEIRYELVRIFESAALVIGESV